MAISNINAKIVNRMTKMCVVDSQSQHAFIVACLSNAVSLRCSTCITIVLYFNAIPSVLCMFNMTGASYSTLG